jgi:hypothetical protein
MKSIKYVDISPCGNHRYEWEVGIKCWTLEVFRPVNDDRLLEYAMLFDR